MVDAAITSVFAEEAATGETSGRGVEPKAYEVGYLLNPLLTEEEAGRIVVAIRNAVENEGGMIMSEGIPEMRRLAYPINKQSSAYFGWMKFILKGEAAPALRAFLARQDGILRSLFVSRPEKERRPAPPRPASRPRRESLATRTRASESVPVDSAEIDKRLEELIGAEQ